MGDTKRRVKDCACVCVLVHVCDRQRQAIESRASEVLAVVMVSLRQGAV